MRYRYVGSGGIYSSVQEVLEVHLLSLVREHAWADLQYYATMLNSGEWDSMTEDENFNVLFNADVIEKVTEKVSGK